MKLSEFRGEDAIDVLAEIIEPASEIIADEAIQKIFNGNGKQGAKVATVVKLALKNHKKAVIQIMAACDGKSYDEMVAEMTVFTLPLKALEIFNDKELVDFFQSQVGMIAEQSFGSATENTVEEA